MSETIADFVKLGIRFGLSLLAWLVICCFVALIFAIIRRAKSYGPYISKAAWVALVLGTLGTVPDVIRTFDSWGSRSSSNSGAITTRPAKSSGKDLARFREIIKKVEQDPTFLTPAVYKEFWQLSEKRVSPEQFNKFLKLMAWVRYHCLFWRDALISVRNGQPFKSKERAQCEKIMLEIGMVSKQRIVKNNAMIAKIARQEPISRGDGQIVFDEKAITAVLSNVEGVGRRLKLLFTRPTKSSSKHENRSKRHTNHDLNHHPSFSERAASESKCDSKMEYIGLAEMIVDHYKGADRDKRTANILVNAARFHESDDVDKLRTFINRYRIYSFAFFVLTSCVAMKKS